MLTTIPVTPIHYSAAPTLIVRNDLQTPGTLYYVVSGFLCTQTQCPITVNGSSYWRSIFGEIGHPLTQNFNFGMVNEYEKLVSADNESYYSTRLNFSSIDKFDAQTFGNVSITIEYNKDAANHTFYWTIQGQSYPSKCLDVQQDSETVTATIYC